MFYCIDTFEFFFGRYGKHNLKISSFESTFIIIFILLIAVKKVLVGKCINFW